MTARRRHPHLSHLLGAMVGSESVAQYMLSLYLTRGGMGVEEWVAYRSRIAAILQHLIPLRHVAVQRHSQAVGDTISSNPTLGTSSERRSLLGYLRGSGGES